MTVLAKPLLAAARQPFVPKVVKTIVAAAVLVSVAGALDGYRRALAGRLQHVHLGWLAVALGLSIVYRAVNAYGWVLVLRSLRHPMRAFSGVRLWLVSETLRWLPGSVWSFLSRVAQARTAGVPALTASLSLPLELLLTIAAWGIVACAALGLSGTAGVWLSRVPAVWLAISFVALALTVGAACALLRWRPASALSKKVDALQGSLRELRQAPPRVSLLVAALSLFTALAVLNGAAFLAVLEAVSESPPSLLATVGINAAGWLVGFFAFFAPAGLGVREGGMTAMLAPMMPLDAAVIGVLLWRLIQILVELICLAACFAPNGVSAVRRLAAGAPVEPR
jgi:hypothetical protein